MVKVLFILKYRESDYENADDTVTWAPRPQLSSGLYNSARFVSDMLNEKCDVESKLVQVIDNNEIDREVTKYKPDFVIIEAYWVVPEKFDVLQQLHPNVTWIIRNHSNTPFLANEGIAFGWTLDYLKHKNVYVSCNHHSAVVEFRKLIRHVYPKFTSDEICKKLIYLPNYYPIQKLKVYPRKEPDRYLDIGCFGAVRPLKNHMTQVLAAIEYAHQTRRPLRFHINSTRIEGSGEPILKNIREVFRRSPYEPIEHTWRDHDGFLKLVASMDMGLQVSFTETFNIVAADFTSQNVPVVTSNEIEWSSSFFQADPTDMMSIVGSMARLEHMKIQEPWYNPQMSGLTQYNLHSIIQWSAIFREY